MSGIARRASAGKKREGGVPPFAWAGRPPGTRSGLDKRARRIARLSSDPPPSAEAAAAATPGDDFVHGRRNASFGARCCQGQRSDVAHSENVEGRSDESLSHSSAALSLWAWIYLMDSFDLFSIRTKYKAPIDLSRGAFGYVAQRLREEVPCGAMAWGSAK